ncbi:hypothetical protein WA158_007766 [Blastocystis sp. Blastoise]
MQNTALQFPALPKTNNNILFEFKKQAQKKEWLEAQLNDYEIENTRQIYMERKDQSVENLEDIIQTYEEQVLDSTKEIEQVKNIANTLVNSHISRYIQEKSTRTPLEEEIYILLQRKLQLEETLLSLSNEYTNIINNNNELSNQNHQYIHENQELMTSITAINYSLHNIQTTTSHQQQKETLLQKINKKTEENTILRNIFMNIIGSSTVNWSKDEKLKRYVLCLDTQPGVPEEEFQSSQLSTDKSQSINQSFEQTQSQQY